MKMKGLMLPNVQIEAQYAEERLDQDGPRKEGIVQLLLSQSDVAHVMEQRRPDALELGLPWLGLAKHQSLIENHLQPKPQQKQPEPHAHARSRHHIHAHGPLGHPYQHLGAAYHRLAPHIGRSSETQRECYLQHQHDQPHDPPDVQDHQRERQRRLTPRQAGRLSRARARHHRHRRVANDEPAWPDLGACLDARKGCALSPARHLHARLHPAHDVEPHTLPQLDVGWLGPREPALSSPHRSAADVAQVRLGRRARGGQQDLCAGPDAHPEGFVPPGRTNQHPMLRQRRAQNTQDTRRRSTRARGREEGRGWNEGRAKVPVDEQGLVEEGEEGARDDSGERVGEEGREEGPLERHAGEEEPGAGGGEEEQQAEGGLDKLGRPHNRRERCGRKQSARDRRHRHDRRQQEEGKREASHQQRLSLPSRGTLHFSILSSHSARDAVPAGPS
eukprot:3505810-Rhodomonas_salina.1